MVIRQTGYKSSDFLQDLRSWIENEAIPKWEQFLFSGLGERRNRITLTSKSNMYLDLTILKYTLGTPIKEIQVAFSYCLNSYLSLCEIVDSIAPDENLEQYIKSVQILSFCYFFKVPKEDVKVIADHIPFSGKDRLTDFLIKASIPDYEVTASKLVFPDIYQPLMDSLSLLHEPKSYDQKIQQFLEDYYPGLKKHDVTWYDSHKEEDPEYCFHFGYWIFEAAALMVFTHCDDSPFRDHPFYPTDLVDWRKT